MDFNFTKEEKLLQNSVREYIKDKIAPVVLEEDKKAPLSKKEAAAFLKDLIKFGYIGPFVQAENNGPELSKVEAGIIFSELGKAWASLAAIAVFHSNAISLILNSKNNQLIKKFVPSLMSGEIIGSAAWTEPLAGSDISGIQTTAYPRSDKYIVNGTKTWAANGSVADIALIAAKIDQTGIDKNNLALFLVEKKNSCFETIETPKMGLKALSTAKLVLKDFPVTKDNILIIHEELENRHDWRSFLQKEEKCLTAAISLGIAEASLEAAVSYSKQRMQFGKRLAEFQMIQKMIAEMAVSLDAAKFLTFRALKMLDEGVPCYKEIIMAKTFAAQTAVEAASKAIQIHGAYGYSDELPVERYYRDANCFAILDKSTELQELEIAKEVLGFK